MSRSEIAALAALLALCGCERYPSGGDIRIRSDMVDQPSYRPQEDPRPPAPGAVPVKDFEPEITRQQAERALRNPALATPESLREGERLFRIYCVPCHGPGGRGDGLVGAKLPQPANLTASKYAQAGDGLFYYVMRHGTAMMPPLAESLAPAERWHIVNYLRKLQRP
ncbi:MAG: cytochrome c [Acidobacteriota bacterium]